MSEVIATVNGAPIDEKTLGAAMQGLAQENFHANLDDVPENEHGPLRQMALERLIARELIYQAALAAGVLATAEQVQDEKARVVRMTGNPKDFWARLAERGMDELAFERMVRKDVTADLMTARKLAGLPEPDDAEIAAFFRENPERLQRPDRVRVAHILFPVDPEQPEAAKQKALEVKKLAETSDFGALAKQYSACPSAPGGGDLGFVKREDVDATFADAVFGQGVDEVAGPFQTPYGLHLTKVIERDIPGPPTLEEARPAIIDVLKRLSGARVLKEWVGELRDQADIVIREAG